MLRGKGGGVSSPGTRRPSRLLIAIICLLAFVGAYGLGYVYVRHRFTGLYMHGTVFASGPMETIFVSGTGSRRIWYCLFYPLVNLDMRLTGRPYVPPDGRRIRSPYDLVPFREQDWVSVPEQGPEE